MVRARRARYFTIWLWGRVGFGGEYSFEKCKYTNVQHLIELISMGTTASQRTCNPTQR